MSFTLRIRVALTASFFLLTFALAGCQESPVATRAKAETKVESSAAALTKEAQREVRLAGEALQAAAPNPEPQTLNPGQGHRSPDSAFSVQRSALSSAATAIGRADALLAQAHGPLTAEDAARIATLAAGLLAEESAARRAAEAALAAERTRADTLSRDHESARRALATADDRLAAAYAERAAEARTWRRLKWAFFTGLAGWAFWNWGLPALLRLLTPGTPAAAALGRAARLLGKLFAPTVSGTLTTVVAGLDRAKTALLPDSQAALHTDLSRAMDRDHKAMVRLHRAEPVQS